MAKKNSGRKTAAKGGSRGSNLKRFNVKALHNQLEAVLGRMGSANSAKARALRASIKALQSQADCPQTMALDLS
jgi:ElaB/YqjD/DUF883 family membrane-anchored ribosome-binding protein